MRRLNLRRGFRTVVLCAAVGACGTHVDEAPSAPTPQVTVVTLKNQPVTLTRSLPGRTSAYLMAEVRPQVSGIVKRRMFTEGGTVRAGQVLYDLDDSLYRAQYAARRPVCRRRRPLCRHRGSRRNVPRNYGAIEAVSAQDNDNAIAALGQAEADVAAAQAAVDTGAVNLAYAHIVAPISGRIGKSTVTQGALVTADQTTALATIQQLDPIYVDVNQSSSEWLQLKQEIDAGGCSRRCAARRQDRARERQHLCARRASCSSPTSPSIRPPAISCCA